MTITRNGIKYHLTEEELREAYEELELLNTIEDCLGWMEDHGYGNDKELALKMAKWLRDHHDCTLDYWSNIEMAYDYFN